MRRFLFRLLGLLTFAGLVIPPVAAAIAKGRLAAKGIATFDETQDEIDLAVIFEGGELRSTASSFRGGEMLLWYGGGTLDLRGATLDAAGGYLRVRSLFGGLQVIVPASWAVEVSSRAIFGGVDNATTAVAEPGRPRLEIDALSVFGGIRVTDRAPRHTDASEAFDPSEATRAEAAAAAEAAAETASESAGA